MVKPDLAHVSALPSMAIGSKVRLITPYARKLTVASPSLRSINHRGITIQDDGAAQPRTVCGKSFTQATQTDGEQTLAHSTKTTSPIGLF